MEFVKTLQISAAGMRAQGERIRVIAENVANAATTPQSPDEEPYRRRLVTFENALDRSLGIRRVRVAGTRPDSADFGRRYDPTHPGADENGYVRLPNVNPLIEMTDMRQALRSYQANLKVIEMSKTMLQRTLDLLNR